MESVKELSLTGYATDLRDARPFESHSMTKEKPVALAERIAAVLRERRRIGKERRRREQEYQQRNAERASERYRRMRGAFKRSGPPDQGTQRGDEAMISSNVVDEAMRVSKVAYGNVPLRSPNKFGYNNPR